MQNSNCKYVIALMIDIQGAFDLVWWPIIASRLRELNFSKNIQEVHGSYLSEKEVFLENNGEEVHRLMNKGCPQGSLFRPGLGNLTFDELLSQDFSGTTKTIAFVDDVTFQKESNARRQLEEGGKDICEIIVG